MEDLKEKLTKLKSEYRKVFIESAQTIQKKVEELKPENFNGEIFDKYQTDSPGKLWQDKVLAMFDEEYSASAKKELQTMKNIYKNFHCVNCGTCCKLACSEFSFDELKIKAQYGDNFAKQFINTFVPYNSIEEAQKIFPQYIKLLEDSKETNFYFYHCPKVTKDNKCPDYENRPQICRDFPDNPLAFLPPSCGFRDWKLKSELICLKLNAETEIINFYKNKIKEV